MDMEQTEVARECDFHERSRQLVVVEVICRVIKLITSQKISPLNYVDRPIGNRSKQYPLVREKLLLQLRSNGNLSEVIHMGPEIFNRLCELLQTHGGLTPTQESR